jgi:MFS family permease
MRKAVWRTTGSFRRVWLAALMSNLGDGIYQFALPVIAVGIGGSPAGVAGVTVSLTAAWPMFGLAAGNAADRYDRRRLMLWVNLMRLTVVASLAVAAALEALSLPLLYVVALLLGTGETLVDTSLAAIVPSVVDVDQLDSANGRLTAAQMVANQFLGPPLAGILVAVGWSVAAGVSAGGFGLAVVALASLRGSFLPRRQQRDPQAISGVAAGFRFLWRQPILRRLTLFTAAMNIWWAAWTATIVIYAIEPGPMGLDLAQYGVMLTAMALGGLAGSLAAPRLRARVGTRLGLLLDPIGTVLLLGVPAATTSAAMVGASIFMAGVGAGVWLVIVASIRQQLTPDDLLGRVYAASRMISWGVLPAGAALGGVVAELMGVRAMLTFGTVASLTILVAFAAYGLPRPSGPSQKKGEEGSTPSSSVRTFTSVSA